MELAPEFLDCLRCPLTLSKLRHATSEELAMLNDRIAEGLSDRGEESVSQPVEHALVNAEASWLFPVVNGVIRLVADRAISLTK